MVFILSIEQKNAHTRTVKVIGEILLLIEALYMMMYYEFRLRFLSISCTFCLHLQYSGYGRAESPLALLIHRVEMSPIGESYENDETVGGNGC